MSLPPVVSPVRPSPESGRLLLLADAGSIHTRRWARALAARGREVHVASLRPFDIPGVTVHGLRGPLPGRLGIPGVLPRVRQLVRELRPDLVHAHYATSYGLLGALSGHRPLMISVWGSDVYEWPQLGPLHRALLRFNLSRASLVGATSPELARAVRPFVPVHVPVEVTPFGVEVEVFCPGPRGDGPPVVGTLRTHEWRYGLDVLLRAFALLANSTEARLVIGGAGPQTGEYRALATELGIADRVDWPGFVEPAGLVELYRTFDMFVAPSRIESYCVAAIEAQAVGVPVVATRVGGLPGVVVDGTTGRIVPPEDPAAMAAAIAELLDDAPLRARMGQAARAHVCTHHSWVENVTRMEALYARILGVPLE
ncbi:MAG: glycosyltransferase [bacterium]|nr:glycosyltransferase [bacterium]